MLSELLFGLSRAIRSIVPTPTFSSREAGEPGFVPLPNTEILLRQAADKLRRLETVLTFAPILAWARATQSRIGSQNQRLHTAQNSCTPFVLPGD